MIQLFVTTTPSAVIQFVLTRQAHTDFKDIEKRLLKNTWHFYQSSEMIPYKPCRPWRMFRQKIIPAIPNEALSNFDKTQSSSDEGRCRLNRDTQCLVSDYKWKRTWLLGLTVETARMHTRSNQRTGNQSFCPIEVLMQIWTQIDRANMLWYCLDYAVHQQLSKTKLDAACPYPRDVKP